MELALDAGPVSKSADAPDTWFGAYRLIQRIGEGGMGIVWLAQQEQPIRRRVALKVVKPGTVSPQALARFESERQALALLNHANIATVYDAGLTDDGRPYFAMEYVPGPPITSVADQRALPIVARLELFLQVCDAVEHAHQKGVLHRDLKPANILVTDRDGGLVVKVIDFGVAKALGTELAAVTLETQIGTLVGTPEYMSPEQAGLSPDRVDTRTDIYSLGLVLYELLVGALPFEAGELRGRAVFEMLRVIREEEPLQLTARLSSRSDAEIKEVADRRLTDPQSLVRQLRGDLDWITRRALEKEPARRYATASELGADVRRHLASEPVIAGPPDLTYRLRKLIGRHRGTAIAAGVALAALVIGTVVSSVMWISAERARKENRDRLKILHVTTGLQLASDGDDLKALPWLVRALQLEEGGPRAEEVHRIRIRHVLDTAPYPVRLWKHEGLVGAYLAPDRTTLATWDQQGGVRLWNATTGASLVAPLTHPAPIVSLRISGSSLVSADQRGVVHVWDVRSGTETMAEIAHGQALTIVRVSSASNQFLSADRAGTAAIRALDSGDVLETLRFERAVTFAEFLDDGRTIAIGDLGGTVLLLDTVSKQTIARLPHEVEVVDVTRLDDERLTTTSRNGVLQTWDLRTATAETLRTPIVPSGATSARLLGNRVSAFFCGVDAGYVIDIRWVVGLRRLGTHSNCLALDVSDDALLAATAYADGTVRVWDANGVAFTPRLPHPAAVKLVSFLAESHQLLTVDGNGAIRIWELNPAAQSPRSNVFSFDAEFSPDGRQLALANGSSNPPYFGYATLLDVETREVLVPPLRHGGDVITVTFSNDARLIATASGDGSARLWDAATGEPVSSELRHSTGAIKDIAFSPDGRRLLTFGKIAPSPSNATIWEVPTGRLLVTLPETMSAFRGGFSPDGQYFVTVAAVPPRVQVWQTNDGAPQLVSTWPGFDAATFVSNQQIAIASAQSLEIRDLDGRSTHKPLTIPQSEAIVASGARASLVVPTKSGAIHIVDRRDLSSRFPPLRLPGGVTAADASRDGRWVVGTSWERRARVWSMETGEPVTPERTMALLPFAASFAPARSQVQISGAGAAIWDLAADPRPIPVLERLALWLSGHELIGTQLVPLSIDRLIDLSDDVQVATVARAHAERDWQWMIANQHMSRGTWRAAEAVLKPLVADPNAAWETQTAYGSVMAELGRWAEAQSAFALACKRRPDSTELMFYEALARLAGGVTTAVDESCQAAMQQFSTTRNPDRAHWLARLCVLATTLDGATMVRVRDLARIAADIEPDIGRHVNVYAAALMRANDPAQAERLLLELRARPRVLEPEAAALFLATAQRLLGRIGESTATLPNAREAAARFAIPWYRRVEAGTWRLRMGLLQ